VKLKIKLLNEFAVIPTYAKKGDAGLDLSYAGDEAIWLPYGVRKLVGTGLALEIPYGFVGLIHPRSGLAHKHGITVLNAPGTVDSGYRGEVKVNLYNSGLHGVWIHTNERIAQLVIQAVEYVDVEVVDELSDSARGTGGHGSSGKI
jgi:dUTP diphosphatase